MAMAMAMILKMFRRLVNRDPIQEHVFLWFEKKIRLWPPPYVELFTVSHFKIVDKQRPEKFLM